MKQHVWYTLFGFLFLAAAVFADEVKITGLSREAVVKNEPSRAVMGYLNTSYPDIFRNPSRRTVIPGRIDLQQLIHTFLTEISFLS